jgi:hypothetical protein
VTWKQLLADRRVAPEATDRAEIESLRAVVHRNLADAQLKGLSNDGRFGHAYDAARTLATIVVRASGYRVKLEGGGHYNTFQALKAADSSFSKIATFLDVCRRKRNDFLYEQANVVTSTEAEDFLIQANAFALEVEAWLRKQHPGLL